MSSRAHAGVVTTLSAPHWRDHTQLRDFFLRQRSRIEMTTDRAVTRYRRRLIALYEPCPLDRSQPVVRGHAPSCVGGSGLQRRGDL